MAKFSMMVQSWRTGKENKLVYSSSLLLPPRTRLILNPKLVQRNFIEQFPFRTLGLSVGILGVSRLTSYYWKYLYLKKNPESNPRRRIQTNYPLTRWCAAILKYILGERIIWLIQWLNVTSWFRYIADFISKITQIASILVLKLALKRRYLNV